MNHKVKSDITEIKPFPPTTTNPETSSLGPNNNTNKKHHRIYLEKSPRKKHVGPVCVKPGTNRIIDARVTAQRAKMQKNKLRSVKAMVDSGPPQVLKLVKWYVIYIYTYVCTLVLFHFVQLYIYSFNVCNGLTLLFMCAFIQCTPVHDTLSLAYNIVILTIFSFHVFFI